MDRIDGKSAMGPVAGMETARALKALLDWQAELGADTPMGEAPLCRFAERVSGAAAASDGVPAAARPPARGFAEPAAAAAQDPVAAAQAAAAGAGDLDALRAALAGYPHCDLRHGARNLVFADGVPGAPVMIVGEAPGRDEDARGLPFVGRAGQLLDRMFAAIGLSRAAQPGPAALYITNMLPWRPPQNRTPSAAELAMFAPFVHRHIALAAPRLLVLMGNTACAGLLGRGGITRLRGGWTEVNGRPALPMFHPAYLLRSPAAKREAWADLLSLRARLEETA